MLDFRRWLSDFLTFIKPESILLFNAIKHAVTRFLGFLDVGYLRKWLVIGIAIGIVAGVGSILFYLMIQWVSDFLLVYLAGYIAPLSGGEGYTTVSPIERPWVIPIVTTLGGLLSGLIVYKFAPEAEGHGTDAAIGAFHNKGGSIRKRVPLVKMLASALTIGSGGSAGREGPVALIGAGFGSTVAKFLAFSKEDRRIALTIGMGAGIGSIFKAPLGGALLSTEILYKRDFEVEALLPSFIASITGYAIFASWHGWTPIFSIQQALSFSDPLQLVGYAILGLACGIVGMAYGRSFYRIRDFFKSLNMPTVLKPALGGLIVGLIGMFLPQILSMGYGWLQLAIDGNYTALPVYVMVAALVGKIIATSVSIGSGGSGGVFAPGLFIGGMVGGLLWYVLSGLPAIVPPDPNAFVIVGMMALFGGIAKASLAIMIMVSEMTNSYVLLAPCMIAVVIAYFASGNSYIYENQVVNRSASPAHRAEYAVPLLRRLKAEEAINYNPVIARPTTSILELEKLMKAHRLDALPVLEGSKVVGIVANLDIVRVPRSERENKCACDIMSTRLIVAYAHESLDIVMERMLRNNISHLVMLDDANPLKFIGILRMDDIIRVYRRYSHSSDDE